MLLILANLSLRLALLAWATSHGHWHGGDTDAYLGDAAFICQGGWGGLPYRVPLYPWLICHLGVNAVLVLQSLLLWAVGVFLFRRAGKWIAALWLFDPVLLVYGNMVMTDVLFAAILVPLGILIGQAIRKPGPLQAKTALGIGVLMGIALLTRPIALPFFYITLPFLVFSRLEVRWRVLAIGLALALIAPRLYWNKAQHGRLFLADQGISVLHAIGAVAKYHGQGLDFYQAEAKWAEERRTLEAKLGSATINDGIGFALRTILENWKSWLWLSIKGTLRVLIGHVNVEWTYLFTGQVPLGPGWFKEGGTFNEPNRIQGWAVLPWIAGMVVAGIWMIVAHGLALWTALKEAPKHPAFVAWLALSVAYLASITQVFGDARFRIPVIALYMVLFYFRPKLYEESI